MSVVKLSTRKQESCLKPIPHSFYSFYNISNAVNTAEQLRSEKEGLKKRNRNLEMVHWVGLDKSCWSVSDLLVDNTHISYTAKKRHWEIVKQFKTAHT